MGKYIREGTSIEDFTPDDDENTFYICEHACLSEIIDNARTKWGDDVSFENIDIEAKYIHTECLGYDLYDPNDYTRYLKITRNK